MDKIAIIGLGYVGLPLACLFSEKYVTVGYDINKARVKELNEGKDLTREVSGDYLNRLLKGSSSSKLIISDDVQSLEDCNVYIVTVPTPLSRFNVPDLRPLEFCSKEIGGLLKKGDIVIYESTVYPGLTEEVCVPILARESGLTFNQDFFVGYSPERINPGDKERTVATILKITSGSTPEIAQKVDKLYASVITAGTYLAPSIKVAEAAKAIENAQRDLNISFVNELAMLFDKMEIDTTEVINAAATKWNFVKYKPGLVGGHCIGVDPYYLAFKAQELGFHTDVLLSGRRVNDQMGAFVAQKVVKSMIKKDVKVKGANILALGITFKENCPDLRNSKAIDVVSELQSYGINVDVYDPWADAKEVYNEYKIDLLKVIEKKYDGVVLVVAHDEFLNLDYSEIRKESSVLFDIKAVLDTTMIDGRL